jgi:tripartite-type tricarboxylate transporter receptor subunit TctC
LWLEQLNAATGLQIIHVPYKGIAPAITDMLGGRLAGIIVDLPAVMQYVKGGQMRLIGMVGSARHPAAPEIPTLEEQGVSGLDLVSWYGVFAPARTPPATVARLAAAIEKAMADTVLREQVRTSGAIIAPSTPDQLARIIREDRQRWAALIKEKNIVVQPN